MNHPNPYQEGYNEGEAIAARLKDLDWAAEHLRDEVRREQMYHNGVVDALNEAIDALAPIIIEAPMGSVVLNPDSDGSIAEELGRNGFTVEEAQTAAERFARSTGQIE